jgi:hypothetical protein
LVTIAERIEQAIHLGNIVDYSEVKSFTWERKEIKVHNIEGDYKSERKSYQNKDI